MIVSAILFIIKDIDDIKTNFGNFPQLFEDLTHGNWSAFNSFGSFFWQIFTIIVGLTAVFAAIGGHGGFWFTIFSLIMLVFFIMTCITGAKGGAFKDWKSVAELIANFALQIAYIVGFLLLKYGIHREKKEYKKLKKANR